MTVSNGGLKDRTWLEVRLAAIQSNAATVRTKAGVPLLPMVKAEAYGLGMVPVVRALEELDPWGYGVATLHEGLALRTEGITRPIVVFTPPPNEWLVSMQEADLQPVLGSEAAFDAWKTVGGGAWQLDIDTGMARAGVPWEQVGEVPLPERCAGAFTHFACADADADATALQRTRFVEAVERLPSRPDLLHAANSAAVFRGREYAFDLVRPGIFLYGGRPGPHTPDPEVVAVLSARVLHVRDIEREEPVSYGWRWKALGPTTVATLGMGYGDGVPRSIEGRGEVLLDAHRRAIVGAINMDVILVETPIGSTRPGDVATLFGDDVRVDEWATMAGTNAYEILTGLGPRVARIYA